MTTWGSPTSFNKSAEDHQATGLVEDIMKHLKKIFHTAGVEREDPYMKPSCYSVQNHTPP